MHSVNARNASSPTSWKKLARGIYADPYSIQAVVQGAGARQTRRFPKGTDLSAIQRWREETKVRLHAVARPRGVVIGKLPFAPRHLSGWSYLYVIGDGVNVKIGQARNPHQRLKDLQTSHHARLELLATAPAHRSLEQAVHQRFAGVRLTGEWFQLTAEIQRFIEDLQAGRNPALWVWKD